MNKNLPKHIFIEAQMLKSQGSSVRLVFFASADTSRNEAILEFPFLSLSYSLFEWIPFAKNLSVCFALSHAHSRLG